MTKKKEVEYTELDIIMQASADTKAVINNIALQLHEKYEGGMALETATVAAKEYYSLGVLPMELNPNIRKEAEKKVREYHKARSERLKKDEK